MRFRSSPGPWTDVQKSGLILRGELRIFLNKRTENFDTGSKEVFFFCLMPVPVF